jgi:hypothetical protein
MSIDEKGRSNLGEPKGPKNAQTLVQRSGRNTEMPCVTLGGKGLEKMRNIMLKMTRWSEWQRLDSARKKVWGTGALDATNLGRAKAICTAGCNRDETCDPRKTRSVKAGIKKEFLVSIKGGSVMNEG